MSFYTPVTAKRVQFTSREVTKSVTTTATPSTKRPNATSITPRSAKITKSDQIGHVLTTATTNQSSLDSVSSNYKTSDTTNLIKVGIRIRPTNEKEIAAGSKNTIRVDKESNKIFLKDATSKQHEFKADYVITDQESTTGSYTGSDDQINLINKQQQYVYECMGRPLLDRAFDGYNVSVFAYGQTGSGKTYSMIGPTNCPGLIPRFFDDLFEKKTQRDKLVSSSHIEISYYEIYNEKIFDLLRSTNEPASNTNSTKNANLQIRNDPIKGPFIPGLQTLSISSAKDAKMWLEIGNKRRATAYTNMNDKSSRSHSVFQIRLTQMLEHKEEPLKTRSNNGQTEKALLQLVSSQINLVDLAGSERNSTSFGPGYKVMDSPDRSRFKESTCINKSLLTLGKIISQLSERQVSTSTSVISNNNHLPYRDSTLTYLLKESLGGNAKTAMLATVNSSSIFYDETLCTLRYAAKTAKIANQACLNKDFKKRYIDEFGQECEMNLIMEPMTLRCENDQELIENRKRLLQMDQEWKEKLAEAERLKQKEILELEKSLICMYENETSANNCCLINLNEDPILSEKIFYSIKDTAGPILIGSDKKQVDIHLANIVMIAPVHCRITFAKNDSNQLSDYFIEQLDDHVDTKTFVNGERIEAHKPRQLQHVDCIVIGGSHYFRFHNPVAGKKGARETGVNKDYQFAKNEIERCQLEEIRKENEIRMVELEMTHQKDIQNIKDEHSKKLKQLKYQAKKEKHVQTRNRLDECLNQVKAEANEEADKLSDLTMDSIINTPAAKLEKNILQSIKSIDINPYDTSPDNMKLRILNNKETVFGTCNNLIVANRSCALVGIKLEFKLVQLPEKIVEEMANNDTTNRLSIASSTSSSRAYLRMTNFIDAISVIDTSSPTANLVTVWSLEKFEERLRILREITEFYADEKDAEDFSSDMIFKSADYLMFIESEKDEWQSYDEYMKNGQKFNRNILERFMSENGSGKDAVDLGTNTGTKRKCLEFSQDLPGPTPLSCIKSARNAHHIESNVTAPVESDSLIFLKFLKQVYEDLVAEDDTEMDEEVVTGGRPIAYDTEVRNMGCLVENLDKFISSFDLTVGESEIGQVNKCLSMEYIDEEEAPVNANYVKLKKNFIGQVYNSLLVVFYWKPTTWLLISDVGMRAKTKKIYSEIRNGLKRIEALVTRLFQVTERKLIEEKDEVLMELVNEIKIVFQLYGRYKFMESLILNVCLDPTDKVLLSIDTSYVRAYAKGVDEQYREYLMSQIDHFKMNRKFELISEFIQRMDGFRQICDRCIQADIKEIADFCNYAFQCHYQLSTIVKMLKRDERSGGRVNSGVKVFFELILRESNKRNKIVSNATGDEAYVAVNATETCFTKLYQEMVKTYEGIEKFIKEQI